MESKPFFMETKAQGPIRWIASKRSLAGYFNNAKFFEILYTAVDDDDDDDDYEMMEIDLDSIEDDPLNEDENYDAPAQALSGSPESDDTMTDSEVEELYESLKGDAFPGLHDGDRTAGRKKRLSTYKLRLKGPLRSMFTEYGDSEHDALPAALAEADLLLTDFKKALCGLIVWKKTALKLFGYVGPGQLFEIRFPVKDKSERCYRGEESVLYSLSLHNSFREICSSYDACFFDTPEEAQEEAGRLQKWMEAM